MIEFKNPEFLFALVFVPFLIYRYVRRERRRQGSIRFPDLGVIRRIPPSIVLRLRHGLIVLRCLALILLIVALARPRSGREEREIFTRGIDIVLALDVSGSMAHKDLDQQRKSRLQVSKEVVSQFVRGRVNDRLGLVVFAGESYTQCPLTLDYGIFLSFLNEVRLAEDSWDGTAIGTGIITAVNRLRRSEAESRVIILLTDGVNNRGEVDPVTAARAAHAVGIRIYTIGAGSDGVIVMGQGLLQQQVRVEIDEETLTEVADITGGRYFRATSEKKLEEIYRAIGEMEKTEVKTRDYVDYSELFTLFLWPALLFLGVELLLANTRFRRIP